MSRNATGNGNGRYQPVELGSIRENGPTGPTISAPTDAAANVLPTPTKYTPSGTIPNTPFFASFISWCLGGLFWACITSGIVLLALQQNWLQGVTFEGVVGDGKWTRWCRPQLMFYLASWSLFHQLEFWTTAACNVDRLSVDAFLLNNGKQYHTAHIIGLTEYFITCYLINDTSASGIPANTLTVRKWWMGYGSLIIAYTGFFYWALSTQLLLGNTVSFIGFWFVLSKFFKWRIIDEEIHLVRYFGDAYLRFRQRMGHWLPVNTEYKPSPSSVAQGKAKVPMNGVLNGGAGKKHE
ncbi:hypothetical protein QFC21_000652 [Naganishia friedmannii]|uniref:Uncharacterized protein n=1 Tax=Naganishia friedmannii TaxID=89922 RepID=A0ACC2WD57_9TREE|nr:hypothetical protein QFC21_000652 [Naganishia friedmannii]